MNRSPAPGTAVPATPSFKRRMGSVLYEALVVTALWMLASAVVTTIFGSAATGLPRILLQLSAITMIACYFVWCWSHGGQTLAMKTWRIRVTDQSGTPLSLAVALRRFALASAGVCLAGIGLWWALLDKDGEFLHDRLGRTRLVLLEQPGRG